MTLLDAALHTILSSNTLGLPIPSQEQEVHPIWKFEPSEKGVAEISDIIDEPSD